MGLLVGVFPQRYFLKLTKHLLKGLYVWVAGIYSESGQSQNFNFCYSPDVSLKGAQRQRSVGKNGTKEK